MKNKTRSLFANRLARIIVISTVGASAALGCAWSMLTEHSVRFNSMRTGRGFYRLPPLPVEYDPVSGKERSTKEIELYLDENPEMESVSSDELSDPNVLWKTAVSAIEAGDIDQAVLDLEEFLNATQYRSYWDASEDSYGQRHRNSAIDILDALAERERGATGEAALAYATARLATVHVSNAEAYQLPSEEEAARTGSLKDNWAYLSAANLYKSGKKAEALAAFQEHDRQFSRSEKNEAVIYMIGKLFMERGDELTRECTDDACNAPEYESAIQQFKRILRQYPNGRYAFDARGWLGHLYRHQDKMAESLAEYYRLLGNKTDRPWRLEAKKSLQIIGHEHDDATLDKVEALIANEPDAALAYAYHRIYNHAIDRSYAEYDKWCCYGDDKWSQEEAERKRVVEERAAGRHELERVAKFATAMVKKFGTSRVSGEFLLRLSQANLELENFRDALVESEKALKTGLTGNSRAEALWIKGSAEHHQKKLDSARATFSRLITEFPDHKLTEGSRRLLAITAEDQGDLDFALDQYIALDYKYDVAYFVDILLTPEQLAKYLETRKHSTKYNELRYALGVRYLRERRWQDARDVLRSVKTQPARFDPYEYGNDRRSSSPKEPNWDDYGKPMFIRDVWIFRDVKSAYALEELERSVENAVGDEATAEAMYQLASYYYEASSLLLYNPAAWDGGRYRILSEFNSERSGSSNDDRLVFEHFQSHDTLARAIPIYLEIVDRFPETKASRDALYSAAVAHERLSSLNPYWRGIYGKGLFAGPRRVTYDDVQRKYPNYQLPRGTDGWEPSTRTVNGGLGWAAKRKPLPKLTTEQRVVRKLSKWKGEYGPWIGEKASWAWGVIKDGASTVSSGVAGYLTNYFVTVYLGFIALLCWTNRKELYEGPVTKGAFLAHQGGMFLIKHIRQWLNDIALPSIIQRSKPSENDNAGNTREASE